MFRGVQAAQRGVKAAIMTQPDPEDPLKEHYGDYGMIQSQGQSGRVWTKVESLSPALSEQKVRSDTAKQEDCARMVWMVFHSCYRGGGSYRMVARRDCNRHAHLETCEQRSSVRIMPVSAVIGPCPTGSWQVLSAFCARPAIRL